MMKYVVSFCVERSKGLQDDSLGTVYIALDVLLRHYSDSGQLMVFLLLEWSTIKIVTPNSYSED